jgi:hypothetical protein
MKGEDAMNRTVIGMVVVGCVLAFGSFSANAQVPSHMVFDVEGTVNFMVSPVVFDGAVTAGEPLLLGGYWTLQVDDTGWPADTDKQARWDYIAANYYEPNYDSYSFNWTATFDEHTTNSAPTWGTGKAVVGDMTGTATLQITITDFNFNEMIDPDERAFVVFSGTLIVVKNGEGMFAGYCGLGSFSGSASNPDPVNFADDSYSGTTILDVEDCSVPAEQVSWGHVKALYQ